MREVTPQIENYHAAHAAADPSRKLTRHDLASDMERGFIIVGDPQRCIDIPTPAGESRSDDFFVYLSFRGHGPAEGAQDIRLFAERVMPALEQV